MLWDDTMIEAAGARLLAELEKTPSGEWPPDIYELAQNPLESLLADLQQWHADDSTTPPESMDYAVRLTQRLRPFLKQQDRMDPVIRVMTVEEANQVSTAELLNLLVETNGIEGLEIRGFNRDDWRGAWYDLMEGRVVDDAATILKSGFTGWEERSDAAIYVDLRLNDLIYDASQEEASD